MPRSARLWTATSLTVATALALAALPGCSSSAGPPSTSTEAASASAPSATGFDGALLPADAPRHGFTLRDQYGRRLSLSALHGRVAILAFLYTSSRTTAPLIAQQIRGALDELGSHPPGPVPVLAISVDPERDTPAHIRAFLRENSLSGRVEYLTGTLAQLRAVWRAYAVVPASAGPIRYERAAFVLLLDRAGRPRVEFPLEELTPEALAHDIRKLQAE